MKSSIAKILHASGMDRRYGANNSHYPLIIAYHRVVENFQESSRSSIPSMLVSTDTFRAHLEWIGTRYDYGTLDEVLLELERMHRGEKPRKRPLAAITFDDGYVDVL